MVALMNMNKISLIFKGLPTSGSNILLSNHVCLNKSKHILNRSINLHADKIENKLIKKWVRYWEDLLKDYADVVKETVDYQKDNPGKTFLMWSLFGLGLVCFKTNPDELSYRDNIIACSNEVLLVAKDVRNPRFDKYLTSLENCHNLGLIRRLSFGIASVMWIDDYSNELGIYKATCSTLKPQYLSFYERIVDIGFLGKWWKVNQLMEDYDVNNDEWDERPNEK